VVGSSWICYRLPATGYQLSPGTSFEFSDTGEKNQMRCLIAALLLVSAGSASAQVVSRPTEPPIVTAENDAWYRLREPVLFAGEAYYPAGATVFFNGNTMVRTGHYNGVPLYADTTIEPYSVVLVPIGGGLLQPYERVRAGDLAGTVGSRTPSFPVRTRPEPREVVAAPSATTAPAQPRGLVSAVEEGAVGTSGRMSVPTAVGTGGTITAARPRQGGVATVRRAESNDGIWLRYMGARWISAGPAVPLRASEFVQVGEYAGNPVYARKGLEEDRIYLPSAGGVIPFRLKE
jgi:hypothetical protein